MFCHRRLIVAFALLCILVCSAGCNEMIAEQLSAAPNLDSPHRGQDAAADVLKSHFVSQQLRINVGPPTASLSVWIVDPDPDRASFFSIAVGPRPEDLVNVQLWPKPRKSASTTRPATFHSELPLRGTIFFLHGLGLDNENISSELYALALVKMGYRVVMVDLRGHGRSTGDRITFGATESRDMVQVLDALQGKGLITGPVGAMGISYGASLAICWAAIDPRVRAVVAMEPFSSIRETNEAVRMILGTLSLNPFFSDRDLQDIGDRVGRLGHFDPDCASPLAAITWTQTPVLLIHGLKDTFLPPAHSIRLHNAAPDHSRLLLVPGANHFDLWLRGEKLIVSASGEWFRENLSVQSSRR